MEIIKFIVDGKEVTYEELKELQNDPKKRLKKLSEGVFKVLTKLEG